MTERYIDLLDPELIKDPFTGYGRLRDLEGLAKGGVNGVSPMWLATRYDDVRTVLGDPRFVVDSGLVPGSDGARPDVVDQLRVAAGIPEEYLPYLSTGIADVEGQSHARLRSLVSKAFTAGRVAALRPRIERITDDLLADMARAEGAVDLLAAFAYPLPIAVICELVGIPESERPSWRAWSAALATGAGPGMGEAVKGMADHAKELIARRRSGAGDDLVSTLSRKVDGDRLSETELVTLILNLVVAGHETTANLIANGVIALLTHPWQLELLKSRPELLPSAVTELMRWCGPSLGSLVRYAVEDVELGGSLVRAGEPVLPVLAAANHDPAVFAGAGKLDITRQPRSGRTHVGFGHGPHYCLGALLAKQEAEVAFGALLREFPALRLAVDPAELRHGPNPGTWHFAEVPLLLNW
ncbi:cytochrome P450 [Saccharomonospora sp. NPDC006951]